MLKLGAVVDSFPPSASVKDDLAKQNDNSIIGFTCIQG